MIIVDYGTPRLGVDFKCNKSEFKKIADIGLIRTDRIFTLDKRERKPNANNYKLVIKTHFSFKYAGVEEIALMKLTGTYNVTFSPVENNESPDDIEKLIVCIQRMFDTTYEAVRREMKGTLFEKLNTVPVSRGEIIEQLKTLNKIWLATPPDKPELN